MRLIDADTLKREAQKLSTEVWKTNRVAKVTTILNQFIDWVEVMPTIDAVKVVRCKDCRWYERPKAKIFENCCRNNYLIPVEPNDYCSYGERRKGSEVDE